MSKVIKFLSFLVVVCIAYGFILNDSKSDDKKYSYVGVAKCKICHNSEKQGKQYTIWEGTEHSKAYEALKTDKANEIAKAKGFKTKAVETKDCLKCHASGYDVDASLKGDKFKVEDGVQCETCHGPGSDYQKMSIMKDREKDVLNGLLIPKDIETFCKTCHNSESPTFKSFKFADAWSKIKHDIPKSK
jgi:hypothetical protein